MRVGVPEIYLKPSLVASAVRAIFADAADDVPKVCLLRCALLVDRAACRSFFNSVSNESSTQSLYESNNKK